MRLFKLLVFGNLFRQPSPPCVQPACVSSHGSSASSALAELDVEAVPKDVTAPRKEVSQGRRPNERCDDGTLPRCSMLVVTVDFLPTCEAEQSHRLFRDAT